VVSNVKNESSTAGEGQSEDKEKWKKPTDIICNQEDEEGVFRDRGLRESVFRKKTKMCDEKLSSQKQKGEISRFSDAQYL